MSDDFIPLNQSTPLGGRQRLGHSPYPRTQQHRQNWHNNSRRGNNMNNKWRNNSHRNSSYGSDSNGSFGQDQSGIDAYLHPSMTQDPWEPVRRWMAEKNQ